ISELTVFLLILSVSFSRFPRPLLSAWLEYHIIRSMSTPFFILFGVFSDFHLFPEQSTVLFGFFFTLYPNIHIH
ncbi:MAG: hypothetical protein IK099_09625, partial [Clostridia bacterium]|nr:hypothetical protein [Clostridia bacterium]